MKILRLLLIGAGIVVALVVVVIVLALNSGVQTWATRKALAGQPDLKADVGRVSAGLSSTRLENVRVEQPGMVLKLPLLEIDVAAVAAARGEVTVTRLVAKGWVLDLSAPAPAAVSITTTGPRPTATPTPTPSAPATPIQNAQARFEGIFKQLNLPVDLVVDAVDLEGDVILPEGTAHVIITGGGLASGREGKFNINGDLIVTKADAPVTSIALRNELLLHMDTARSIDRVELVSNAKALGPQFPQGATTIARLSAAGSAQGETYKLVVESAGKSLVTLDALLPAGAAQLTGTLAIDARDTDVAAFALGTPLPTFTALGGGTFSANTIFTEFQVKGSLDFAVSKLEAIQKEFASLGALTIKATYAGSAVGDQVRIDALSFSVVGAKPVLSVEALQPIKLNLATGVIDPATPAADLARVRIDGIPLAWAQPFLTDMVVTAEPITGEYLAAARNGGFSVRAVSPITIKNLSIAQAGKPVVKALDLSLSASADYTPQGWQAEIANLSAQIGAATLLKLSARAGQLATRAGQPAEPLKATGSYEANLPGLMALPAADMAGILAQGAARGDFTASVGAKQEIALKLLLSGLVATNKDVLPDATLDLRADINADGRIEASAPIVITRGGRKSDVQLSAVLVPGKDEMSITGQLTGEQIYFEDVKPFAAFSGESVEPEPTSKPKPKTPGPLWAGIVGELKLGLKKVIWGGDLPVSSVVGSVKITRDALTFDAQVPFGTDSDMKVTGGIRYNEATANHYALKTDLALNNFDTGVAFRAINPGKLPTLDTKLTIAAQFAGSAPDLEQIADTARGSFQLSSKGGIFRGLTTDQGNLVGQGASVVSALGGLLGGGKTQERVNNVAAILVQIAAELKEIKFDQLNVNATRDASLDIKLNDFTLISPKVRLAGQGAVKHVDGRPVLAQPFTMSLSIAARGDLGEKMKSIGLVSDTPDNLGYLPISVALPALGGTLENIETGAFFKELAKRSAVKGGAGLLNSLMGGGN